MLFEEYHRYGELKETQLEVAVPATVFMAILTLIGKLALSHFLSGWVYALLTVLLVLLLICLGFAIAILADEAGDVSSSVGVLAGTTYGIPIGYILASGFAQIGWEIFPLVAFCIFAIHAFRHYLVIVPQRTTDTTPALSSRPSSTFG